MERLENWEPRLFRVIEEARKRPFRWGQHDCCFFASSCVEAISGKNFLKKLNPIYSTREEAIAFLKTEGQGDLFKTLKHFFGSPVHPAKIHRGDLLYLIGKSGPSLGVSLGSLSAFVGEEGETQGLVFLPTLSGQWGFRI